MVKGYMKRCSPSLSTREMQVKTTVRYHITLVRMAIIQKSKIVSVGEDVKKREPLHTVGGIEIGAAIMGNSMELPPKIKIKLPHGPATPFLGIYTKDTKSVY